MLLDSKTNKSPDLEIRKSEAGEILFMPYSKKDRCNKCVLYQYIDSCKKTPCTAKERPDKTSGYYRKFRAHVTPSFPVPSTTILNN